MARIERILIAGGGIAGLTAAIALRRRGFAPELVEQSESWRALGAGIVIQPNAMRLLRSLAVGTEIEEAGAAPRRFKFLSREGDLLCEIDLIDLWSRVGSGVALDRGALQKALVRATDGAHCRLGVRVTGVRPREDFITVDFSDGKSRDYDLVIGADGIGSTVRTLAVSQARPEYCGQMAWRSLARLQSGVPHGELAGMDRAIVLNQDHRLGRLTALGTIKPVQLLEMGDESLLRLVGLVWTMSWRVT